MGIEKLSPGAVGCTVGFDALKGIFWNFSAFGVISCKPSEPNSGGLSCQEQYEFRNSKLFNEGKEGFLSWVNIAIKNELGPFSGILSIIDQGNDIRLNFGDWNITFMGLFFGAKSGFGFLRDLGHLNDCVSVVLAKELSDDRFAG